MKFFCLTDVVINGGYFGRCERTVENGNIINIRVKHTITCIVAQTYITIATRHAYGHWLCACGDQIGVEIQ